MRVGGVGDGGAGEIGGTGDVPAAETGDAETAETGDAEAGDAADRPGACPPACAAGESCVNSGCAFSPSNLEGLALWLRPGTAATDENGRVARWPDASRYGNDAVQETAANRPGLGSVDAGGVPRPIVTFGAPPTWLVVADAPSLQWGTDDFLVAVVVESNPDPGIVTSCIFRKQDSTDAPYQGVSLWANFPDLGSGLPNALAAMLTTDVKLVSNTAINDRLLHVVVFRRAASRLELRIDGQVAQATDGIPSLTLSSTEPGYIGSHGMGAGGGAQELVGAIAEVVIVRGPLAPATVSSLEHDIGDRSGVTW
jgi:hypothetical protein